MLIANKLLDTEGLHISTTPAKGHPQKEGLTTPGPVTEALGQGQESGGSGRKVAKAIGGANESPPARPNGQ
jgi:hypothetical protein